MSDVKNLAAQFGVELPDTGVPEKIKNEGGGGFYEHKVGKYQALIGDFKVQFVNKEGEKCERGTPGSKPAYGMLRFLIIRDPDGQIFGSSFKIPENVPYGRMVYNQYIPLEAGSQWQNVGLFSDFTVNDNPQLNIIQGEKNNEDVYLNNLVLFYGAPVQFELEQGKKSRYIARNSLVLLDHTLTKELIQKRKVLMDSILSKVDQVAEKERAERESKKKENKTDEGRSAAVSDAEDPDDFLGDFGDLGRDTF